MTQQFHEGQEVEVYRSRRNYGQRQPYWRKAKTVAQTMGPFAPEPGYIVQFPDGTRGVFDAEHIRAVDSFEALKDFDRKHPARLAPDSSRIG